MNPAESTDLSPAALVALRNDPDAMRLITERLKVRDMGPADHIRTKHEVKQFVETGDALAAEELIAHARERLKQRQSLRQTQHLRQGEQRSL